MLLVAATVQAATPAPIRTCLNTAQGLFCPDGITPHPATRHDAPRVDTHRMQVTPIDATTLLEAQRGPLRLPARVFYDAERGLVQRGID